MYAWGAQKSVENILIILSGYNRVNRVRALNDTVNYCDLTFVFSGELRYRVNGTPVTVRSGDGIFIPTGSHRVRLAGDQEAHYFSINFLADEELYQGIPLHLKACLSNTLKEQLLFLKAIRADHTGTYTAAKQALTLELLFVLIREQLESTSRNPYINVILSYIREHFQQPLTLQDIAEAVHLTVPYCCSLVKEHLGTTIYALILEERLHLAKEYILRGEKSLQQIPALCGFRDYGHFSKSFRKHVGIPPSQYRTAFSIEPLGQ